MVTVVLGFAVLVAWASFEVLIRPPGSARSLDRQESDRASTALLIASYALAIVVPVLMGGISFGQTNTGAWLGVAVALGGLGMRAWGMRTLGASYTRTLKTTSEQALVTSGPYGWIRHPGYLGSICVWVGATLAFHSWISAIAVACAMGVAYGWRINSEERMLSHVYGEAFRVYAARTARLIPGVY